MDEPLYDRLGIDMSALGCVMLDAEPLNVHDFLSKDCPGKVAQLPTRGLNYGDLPAEAQA